jgi:MFS family permease
MPELSPDRPRKFALVLIFATVCIDLLGFGLVLPLLPIYANAKSLTAGIEPGLRLWIPGLLMVSYSIMQFLFAPIWGRVSDRVGRRPVLLVSLSGSTIFYLLFGIATLEHSLVWMFVARIGAGIAGATIPTAQAYIADITRPEERARGMATIGAAFGLGFTLGPLLGAGAILLDYNYFGGLTTTDLSPWPGYAASILSATALAFAVLKLPESYDPLAAAEERRHIDLASLREALSIPSIGLLLVTSFFAVFALANFEGTISMAIRASLGEELSEAGKYIEMLLVFAYIGVIMCLVQGVIVRRLALRVNEAWLAKVGAVLSIAGFALLGIAAGGGAGIALLMVAAAVEVGGIALMLPAIQSLISRRSDPARQGGILGAGESISAIARITGTVFGLRLYQQAAPLPFWLAAGLMAVVLVLVVVAVRAGRDFRVREEGSPIGCLLPSQARG